MGKLLAHSFNIRNSYFESITESSATARCTIEQIRTWGNANYDDSFGFIQQYLSNSPTASFNWGLCKLNIEKIPGDFSLHYYHFFRVNLTVKAWKRATTNYGYWEVSWEGEAGVIGDWIPADGAWHSFSLRWGLKANDTGTYSNWTDLKTVW